LGCGACELAVVDVEGVVAAEGDAQVVEEDDAVVGEERGAETGVAGHLVQSLLAPHRAVPPLRPALFELLLGGL
jgi:hypothetical protein